MNHRDSEDDQLQWQMPGLSLGEQEDQLSGPEIILGPLKTYFEGHADTDDLAILGFTLHHLFYSIDALYQIVLPELAESLTQAQASQTELDTLLYQHRIWTHLREIQRLLERIEPLCHLLNGATTSILNALDIHSSARQQREPVARQDDARQQDEDQPYEQYLRVIEQEQWKQTITLLTESLHQWQNYHDQRFSFTIRFAELITAIPALAQTDSALDLLLESAGAIFGDILLNFQAIAPGDDESISTLLLDLMQKADQLLLDVDILLEPMHALIKHHVPGPEMACS